MSKPNSEQSVALLEKRAHDASIEIDILRAERERILTDIADRLQELQKREQKIASREAVLNQRERNIQTNTRLSSL